MDDMTPFPEIWVVFSENELIGIYPNDQAKAVGTRDTLREAGYPADAVKYLAAEFTLA